MKFLAFCFLVATCYLLYDRANLSKEIEAANAKVQKMDDLQKRFDQAQAQIAHLQGKPAAPGSPPVKDDAWFKEALKSKIK